MILEVITVPKTYYADIHCRVITFPKTYYADIHCKKESGVFTFLDIHVGCGNDQEEERVKQVCANLKVGDKFELDDNSDFASGAYIPQPGEWKLYTGISVEEKLDIAIKALEKYSITSSYYVHSTVTGNAKRDCAKKKPVEMAEIARQALKEIKGN